MQVSFRQEGEVAVCTVSGRLDTATAPEFEQQCQARLPEGQRRLVVDLSDLEYISSAGLRSLLVLAKMVKKTDGTLSLCGLKGLVREILMVSGFDSFLTIHEDLASALAGAS